MQARYSLAVGAVAVSAALTASLLAVSARATTEEVVVHFESSGESGPFLLCFYECKRNVGFSRDDDDDDDDDHDGHDGHGSRGYWKEVTVLVLANQRNATIGGQFYLFDGNQTVIDGPISIYSEAFNLSAEDLEEINVCRRADQELGSVPEAGTIVVDLLNTGVYGWVKNVLGEIGRYAEDPFDGRVRDVAKTECRVVPLPPSG